MLGWSYYGDRARSHLFKRRGAQVVRVYRWVFVLNTPVGAVTELKVVRTRSDIFNGLMAFPNLVGVMHSRDGREDRVSRSTKIVATYGPAVASEEGMRAVVRAGANVIRLNFSHGEHSGHAAAVRQIRKVAEEEGQHIAILQDLRGPKIRVGILPEPIELVVGGTACLSVQPGAGGAQAILIEGDPTLGEDVRPGETILLNDGAVRLKVVAVAGPTITCEVVVGGEISSHKGVNFPETHLKTLETITEKDRRDLEFGLSQGVDWVALSFVRSADDIHRLREIIASHAAQVPIVAKIEKGEALRSLEEIVTAAEGIMVARGDLGVETALEEVVLRQKEIIRACNRMGRVVITATQMLESMMEHPTPTRAEVSDVSNAVFDGTDAIMLSGETAVGKYPIEAISVMASIAKHVEGSLGNDGRSARRPFLPGVSDAVAHAACVTAHEIKAKAIICLTKSGLTAQLVSRYRPACPVLAVSPRLNTVRRLALQWGVVALRVMDEIHGEELLEAAMAMVVAQGLVAKGEPVVITAGMSNRALKGKTNLVRAEIL